MAWDRELATEHVEALAKKHDIDIYWTDKPADSHTRTGTVWAPKPISGIKYLVVLHELGHCLNPLSLKFERQCASSKPSESEILCEAAAWAWAAQHVSKANRANLRPRDWSMASAAWGSYLRALGGG